MLRRLHDSLPRWHRAVRRRRRLLSILLAALLAVAVLPGLLPASADARGVLVAAHDLPAGTVIRSGDLRETEVADALVPDDSTSDPSHLEGLRVSRGVGAGEVLAPQRLREEAESPPLAGRGVVVVPVAPALLPHLAPGDELSLVVSTEMPGDTRRIDAMVVEVPADATATGPMGAVSSTDAVEILVAVDPSHTGEVAHAVREGWLEIAIMF
ncbi:SAF domain-containing protein [Brachybacterium sp. MASK1Z-5]|uniref:SAF domain-containing protein n=1 Tax=Brachybacterium halotolerans TaxID=2795215 RepID=A0ABS1BE86_9MICO|nr:SAF domain-containing protein [Brachybacterium halotolerans]MBK0332964.1 SAF domain-containing protein [Brachybacterium halotolerans]